ncbi:nucleoside recognition domain-containing protein [Geomicrobium sp. JCM 19039]|uniref:nucleoside recognition domain-containing protein n=1 Tax=Geomicrobium sp. JCM 19039 TaxID=1460636 RepID=UPI00045F38C8|nr:nucleoside recognition domain-containing protein [Geomicrobium sp. JCM 19039]GAK11668.1 nucleoside binding-domain containing protein [Geomicrobium sp. JCM 19039]
MKTLKHGLMSGLKTTWMLAKIIFPITFLITVLSHTPVLDWIARQIAPVMGWLGLPGEAAIPLVLGNFLNLYAGIGAILSLELTVKEVFILAVMLSFSHNLIVESAVATKLGVRISVILLVRIGLALFAAVMINWLWQGGQEIAQYGMLQAPETVEPTSVAGIAFEGLTAATMGILQLAVFVFPIMLLIQVMRDLKLLEWFSHKMLPFTRLLGIAPNTSTTLASGLFFGLALGAGVMIEEVKKNGVKKKDVYLVVIFLVACHAIVEDTLIFIPLGIPVLPLLAIRLVTAILLTMVVAYLWNRSEKKNEQKEAVAHENSRYGAF